MSAPSKPGSSRIPSFNFRLPQLRSTSNSSAPPTASQLPATHQTQAPGQSRITSGFKVPLLRSVSARTASSTVTSSTNNNLESSSTNATQIASQPPATHQTQAPVQSKIVSGFRVPLLRSVGARTASSTVTSSTNNNHESSSANTTQIIETAVPGGSSSVETGSVKSTIKRYVQSVSSGHNHDDSQVVTKNANSTQHQRISSQEKLNSVAEHQSSTKITKKHIGKKVRVGDKEGVLRYFGIVHFAKEPWCGIELCQPIGKNDGLVNGVRYFTCAALHGLMIPSHKVALVERSREVFEDNDSGPYSMLFIDNNFSKKDRTTSLDTDQGRNNRNTFNRGNQNTFELHKKPNSKENQSQTSVLQETEIVNQDTSKVDRTYDLKNRRSLSLECVNQQYVEHPTFQYSNTSKSIVNLSQVTFDLEKDLTYCRASNQNLSYASSTESVNGSKNHLNRTVTLQGILENQESHPVLTRQDTFEVANIDVGLTACTFTNSKKRTNEIFDYGHQSEAESVVPVCKSFEDIAKESTLEVKRRKTSNSKIVENIVHKNLPLDKPSSLPQLKSVLSDSGFTQKQSTPLRGEITENITKTNWRISDIAPESTLVSSRNKEEIFILNDDDCHNKRDSLEYEDTSLGILTPNQISEYSAFDISKFTRGNGPTDYGVLEKESAALKNPQSPNCNSTNDYSLGILDPHILSAFTIRTDTTMNLDLSLDSVERLSKGLEINRCEQTPSPEELPLDTTPIVEPPTTVKSESNHNTELTEPSENLTSSQKSKPSNTYVTSITTSITSLDTGYQGDGEMSRPASRGADNSPLTRRPLLRPQPRRPDPMTDSDFYTESDADNHDDNQCKESRRAQVIDGTLYGVDPQAAADIYVNNRENMDSSGIFTDIESVGNGRNEEDEDNDKEERAIVVADVSPTESTTKSISVNSQDNIQELLQKSQSGKPVEVKGTKTPKDVINSKKRNAPSPGLGSPASVNSPRRLNNKENHENVAKKYKMPKRDVASKVKTMLDSNRDSPQLADKKSSKKPAGRWDAVMDKISKNDQTPSNFKDVKSKVFNNVGLSASRTNEVRKTSPRSVSSQSTKNRRVRARSTHASSPLKNTENNENSVNSSLSDLSASTNPPKNTGSAKKRDSIQVTQVLTPNKLTRTQVSVNENNKKNAANSNLTPSPSSTVDVKIKRNIFSSKEKKQSVNASSFTKDRNKPVNKVDRTSPNVRSPTLQRTSNPQPVTVKHQHQQTAQGCVSTDVQVPKAAEALAVLIHHLVFNVEAFEVPHLRRQVENLEERLMQVRIIEEERARCRKDITDLIAKHRSNIEELNNHHAAFIAEKESAQRSLILKHEEQLTTVGKELEKLQRSHQEALDILREENDSIRDQLNDKKLELDKMKHESLKLKDDYEKKEMKLKGDLEYVAGREDKLKQKLKNLEKEFEDKLSTLQQENRHLREENDRLLSYGDQKDKGLVLQEVQSLRVVLELKQTEVTELRKSLAEATQKLETLSGVEERATTLHARCEDLEFQLHRKLEAEQSLILENQKLQDSIQEECNKKKRLHQHNEELHWKIQQNKEVITKVMEVVENQGGGEEIFNRSNSIYSSSFNEKHGLSNRSTTERAFSFRERSMSNRSNVSLDGLGSQNRTRKSKNSVSELFDMDDVSPPTSPKVKGVVEKSDSVSYVLDLDESPEVVANRIVRRSFRNPTPPKNNTPTKSPSNKRPRMRSNPLSVSASSSSIVTPPSVGQIDKTECDRPRSASAREGKELDEVFVWNDAHSSSMENSHQSNDSMKMEDLINFELPALPSEFDKRNGVAVLPSPKHLAVENNGVSDSNSEDESTSSSLL